MALYSEYGRVPKEQEIDKVYHLTRILLLIGYARVSTQDQALDLQTDALEQAGCEKIFTDMTSGAQIYRIGLQAAMSQLRAENTLVAWQLDRLGRALKHLIATLLTCVVKASAFGD